MLMRQHAAAAASLSQSCAGCAFVAAQFGGQIPT